ncbi:L-threonylcarbamoyladenylate synthase [Pseudazoarcus pumilus]|uniref:Threonylcarbamoyl-AMP synthase n=1 Tax=Pseudazoarcus pumilus TaxID=2067960 RepID=A0A2I6S5V8_9RHOO|nr:L-threonylcarbamoyladenylate synthase [Pseudazoarcus pumilus]AUN94634.1 threonylcarbamoyl-AMP synthase [Pseudazoarcus pumilus]
MSILAPTPENIARAADALRAGALVGMPTETVYGLAADALDADAVRRVFAAKGRPADHPLIVHLPSAEHLPQWASSIPKEAVALARAFWPGPLTMILRRAEDVPDAVTGGQDTVGVRVPGHPVALALLAVFDSGIAAPSANRFGRISPTTARHVVEELGEQVSIVLDGGACEVGIESTIVDLSRDTPVLMRPGAISSEAIAAVIGRQPLTRDEALGDTPRVSGALAAHYAPRTPLILVAPERLAHEVCRAGRVAVLARTAAPQDVFHWRTAPSDPVDYAHDLYVALRELDALGADLIVVEAPPGTIEWQAVADRLGRAQTGSGEGDET